MKIKCFLLSGTAIMIALSLSLSSCRKHDREKDKDTVGAQDHALAEKSFEDMGQISNEAAMGGISSFKQGQDYDGVLSTCAIIYPDLINKKIVVDFGTSNCLCLDGRYRRGKIYISYSGMTYWDSLAHITVTTSPSDNYFVDDNQVIGTKSIVNNGHNAAGHMNWSFVANGKIIKANNQGTIQWQSTHNREWIAGEGTIIWSDDVYGVTGSASGTSSNGASFNSIITNQLIRKIACPKHFVSGTFDFTPGSKPVRHVDFSPPNNGACDNIATVTINGNTYTVYL